MRAKLILFIMRTRFYKWLLKNILPNIRFSTKYAKVNGSQFYNFYAQLKTGDIVLISDYRKLTSMLIGGEWSHALLYCGTNRFAEMTAKGFGIINAFDLCKESDRIAIVRCEEFDHDYSNLVVKKCYSFEGANYDQEFKLGIEALYCSELIYQSDFERRLKLDLSDFAGIGQEYISPQGLYESKNCKVIYDSGEI